MDRSSRANRLESGKLYRDNITHLFRFSLGAFLLVAGVASSPSRANDPTRLGYAHSARGLTVHSSRRLRRGLTQGVRWTVATRIASTGLFLLAGLAVVAVALFSLAPLVPDQYSGWADDGALLFALSVYAACWAGVLLGLVRRKWVMSAWQASSKLAVSAAGLLVIGYLIWVSWTILAILRSTDL